MFNIRLAELNICIENKYEYIYNMCREYITEENAEVSVSVTDTEIMAEDAGAGFSADYLESLAIYRKIAEKLQFYDGFLLHGAVIEADGSGIAFLAKSGVGKTTHVNLWRGLFGDKVIVINGDKPLIRIKDGKVFAYGTPWAGKENFQTNAKTELKKICFIERSEQNECVRLNKNEVFKRLIQQIYKPFAILGNIGYLIENTEFYLIKCNTDISSAETAYKGLGI